MKSDKMGDETQPDYLKTAVLRWVLRSWDWCFEQSPGIAEKVGEIWDAQIDLGFLLTVDTDPDDAAASLALEIQSDIEASILLAVSGFYRHASLTLRSFLSLAFASVWFSFNPYQYELWMKGEEHAPFRHRGMMSRRFLRELMQKTEALHKAAEAFSLVDTAMNLYQDLSDFVHARGERVQDSSQRDDSVPRFHSDLFTTWFGRLQATFEIWLILICSRFPRLLDTTTYPKEKGRIMAQLPEETRSRLQTIVFPAAST